MNKTKNNSMSEFFRTRWFVYQNINHFVFYRRRQVRKFDWKLLKISFAVKEEKKVKFHKCKNENMVFS